MIKAADHRRPRAPRGRHARSADRRLTHQPVVTVVGKAFYAAGHAADSNRRTYDANLAVREMHPVMQMTESNPAAATAIATTPGTSTPPPPSTPAATPETEEFIVLTQSVTVRIPYGQTTLAPGTRLPVVSRGPGAVNVRYLEQIYPIPVTSTEAR